MILAVASCLGGCTPQPVRLVLKNSLFGCVDGLCILGAQSASAATDGRSKRYGV